MKGQLNLNLISNSINEEWITSKGLKPAKFQERENIPICLSISTMIALKITSNKKITSVQISNETSTHNYTSVK